MILRLVKFLKTATKSPLTKGLICSFFILFSGCTPSDTTTTTPTVPQNKNIEIKVLGLSKFGSVVVGDYRETTLLVSNYTEDTAPIYPVTKDPFFVTSAESPCSSGLLPANQSCKIVVRFQPKTFGEFSTDFLLGDSLINFTGKGLVGGDIIVSETNINLGTISAGQEIIKTLTLTNTGDFTINFPKLTFPSSDYSIFSNYCGSFIDSKKSCEIRVRIVKKDLGIKQETVGMTSTSKGSGTNTLNIQFSSVIVAGEASGNIAFSGNLPSLIANGEQTQEITTEILKDEFGNQVSDGTRVTVQLQNLTLVENSNIFNTIGGKIRFNVKTTTRKGSAIVSVYSGTGYGVLPLYIRAGLPYGSLTVQPYNNKMVADGVTQLGIRFNTIYDKFGNIVEDGTDMPLTIIGGGTISSNNIVYTPSLVASTFEGSAQVTIKSGTTTGDVFVQARANPITDASGNIIDYAAKGDFPLFYIPGEPFGTIPISATKDGINAVEDMTYIVIGPVKDKTNNIVAQNTRVNLNISNGINVTGGGSIQYTDIDGKISFILTGSGNRGPITIKATTTRASGTKIVWAYKDSHLTLQGQKRDDLGNGDGDNNINSGRAYIRYFSATQFPTISDVWDEVFDYVKLSSTDGSYYDIEKINGNPVSTLGGPGNQLPFKTPQTSTIPSIIEYPNSTPIAIPFFESSVLFPAGEKFLNAPFWSKTIATAGTNLFGCANESADSFSNYLYNTLMFTPTSGKYSCDYDGSVVTTNSPLDRLALDTRTNLYWPSIGFVESPLGCSFDSAQSPVFTFKLGDYLQGSLIERTIKIQNPNPTDLVNLNFAFAQGTSANWQIQNIDCGPELGSQQSCFLSIKYINPSITVPSDYSSNLKITSNSVSADVIISVKIIAAGIPSQQDTSPVGMVVMKTNCYSKLVTFGGYNYIWNDKQTETVAEQTNLLSIFNNRGQILSRYNNSCSQFSNELECVNTGQGCRWYKNPNDPPDVPFRCENNIDLGDFPEKGGGLSQFASVGKKLYRFGGFDSSGDGDVNGLGLLEYDTESGKWTSLSPEADRSVDPEDPNKNTPLSRYLNGILYVPQTKSLYIYGGIARNPDPETILIKPYVALNDMWSVNLFETPTFQEDGTVVFPPLKWKRVCENCAPIPVSSIYQPVSRDLDTPGPGYVSPPAVTYMNWNAAHKKVFVNWQGKNFGYWFDPTGTDQTFKPIASSSGANFLASSFQVLFNPRQGRMLSYLRGNPTGNPYISPEMKLWDMDSSEKTYFRTRFKLGEGSKDWATVLNPRIKGYGSVGIDPSCGDPCPGLIAYIYNYNTSSWTLIGENTAYNFDQLKTQGEISISLNDAAARAHISLDGYVDILLMPKGNPSEYNQIHIDSIYLDGTF